MKKYSQKALVQYRNGSVPYSFDEIQSPAQKKLFEILYHPTSDIIIFIMVMISTALLILEVAHPASELSGSWVGSIAGKETTPMLFFVDVIITVFFALEYVGKLWVSPRKRAFFKSNLIELLALIPILRIFRMIRILRALRLIRLVRLNQIIDHNISDQDDETSDLITVLMYLIFSIIFGTVGIMLFEKGHNDGFVHITDGLWWCIVTITTVGYGDISPVTIPGKLVAICIMFIGLAFYASLTGVISEALIHKARRNKRKRMRDRIFSQHVIICGWNQHASTICEQLQQTEEQLLIVITPYDLDLETSPLLFHIKGDPSEEKVLKEAKAQEALHFIILADDNLENGQDRDARSILCVMNALRFLDPKKIIFEINRLENKSFVENLGISHILHLSSFVSTHIYELLTETASALEHYIQTPLTEQYFGCLFQEMLINFAKEESIHLIGVLRQDSVIVPCHMNEKLLEGDILLSYKQ